MTDGLLVEVLTMTRGSATTTALSAGVTTIPVEDPTDFDETGGQVEIAGVVYDYTAVDEDADTITLATGLGDAVPEFEPVLVRIGNEIAVDYYAVVDGPDDDGEPIHVPLARREVRLAWPVGVYDPPLPVVLAPDLSAIVEAPGVVPTIDVSSVPDAATKAELLTAANGKNAVHWSTEPPPDPPDAESIEGDLWWQRDDDTIIGLWRFDGTAWQSQQLGSETIAYLDAGAITVGNLTGITVETRSENERGVKVGYVQGLEGLFVYDDTGAVFLKAVPSEGMAVVAGEVKANTLTVSSADAGSPPGSSLGGTTEIASGGRILLTGGTTAPKSAPTASYGYDTVQFTDDGNWDDRRGWATDGTYWYTARTNASDIYLEKWNATGSPVDSESFPGSPSIVVAGVAVHGGNLYILVHVPLTGDAALSRLATADFAFHSSNNWVHSDSTRIPALGVDPATGELLIAQTRASNADKVRIRRYTHTGVDGDNLTAGASVDTTTAYDVDLAGVYYGSADFGANRYVLTSQPSGGTFRPLTTAGVLQTSEYWDTGMSVAKVGFAHDGSNFVSMDRDGKLRTYTGIWSTTTADMTKWVSNTLANGAGPTSETEQSPRAKVVMAKRSKLNVTTSAIPAGSGADRVRIYVGQGATDPGRTQMAMQTSPAAGVTTKTYTSLTAPPGTNPPATNNFPGGAGSSIDGPSGIFIKHDGTIPAGLFRDAVDLRVTTVAVPVTGGNAAFNSAANAVNTTGKYAGRPGFNSVTGKPIYASGPNATDVWKFYSDDTTAHTPV